MFTKEEMENECYGYMEKIFSLRAWRKLNNHLIKITIEDEQKNMKRYLREIGSVDGWR